MNKPSEVKILVCKCVCVSLLLWEGKQIMFFFIKWKNWLTTVLGVQKQVAPFLYNFRFNLVITQCLQGGELASLN